jgi:hypothetical protein
MAQRARILDFSVKPAFPKTERFGDLEVAFYANEKSDPPQYHYIITRVGQREILNWGQETSEAEAHKSAKIAAHHLLARSENVG